MHRFTKQFVEFCKNNLELSKTVSYEYKSLPICLIDCVYSLRTKYYPVTIPVVKRYADWALDGAVNSANDSITLFMHHIDEIGLQAFADSVVKNHQKLGGSSIPKELVCYNLAKYLHYLHIETIEDFRNFECPELLEIVIRAVPGIGDAGVNYLFMLTGDSDRCKPDVHINHCIQDACGYTLNNDEIQTLFTDTVAVLRKDYPQLTVRMLDGIIWRKYSGNV